MALALVNVLEVLRGHLTAGHLRSQNDLMINKIMQAAMRGHAGDWRSIVSASVSVTITLGDKHGQVWPIVSVDGWCLSRSAQCLARAAQHYYSYLSLKIYAGASIESSLATFLLGVLGQVGKDTELGHARHTHPFLKTSEGIHG